MDGRTLRLLHFRREHPEVQMALATQLASPMPAGISATPTLSEDESAPERMVTEELDTLSTEQSEF